MLRLLIFISCLFACVTAMPCAAQTYVYDYDVNCSTAYQQYMSLHLAEATATINRELHSNPNNLMATYISDYEDCLVLLINCNKADYTQRKDHYDTRLDQLDKGDTHSPWYRVCKAGIYMHWAFIRLRFGENFKAATTFRKSYQLLKENEELFPNFEYTKVFLGLEQTLTGSIPDGYKWVASILGLRGDVRKGVATLSGFVNTHTNEQPLRMEGVLYYAYLKFYLLYQQQEVWSYLNSPQFDSRNNLLNAFVKTNIAVNYRKANVAIQTVDDAQRDKAYDSYPVFNYEMGCALLDKLDMKCTGYFQRYLKRNTGGIYTKDALERMALACYMAGNMQQANYYRQQIKTQGNTMVDADKQAQHFAEDNTWPLPLLLQSRLLIDGGFYNDALTRLNSMNETTLKNVPDQLEYNFRMGRVYDELGNQGKATHYYQLTINIGKDRKEYFAARAALQLAFLYERTGNAKEALARYNECLGMKGHDFQDSIDQQAKAGVNRLTKQ